MTISYAQKLADELRREFAYLKEWTAWKGGYSLGLLAFYLGYTDLKESVRDVYPWLKDNTGTTILSTNGFSSSGYGGIIKYWQRTRIDGGRLNGDESTQSLGRYITLWDIKMFAFVGMAYAYNKLNGWRRTVAINPNDFLLYKKPFGSVNGYGGTDRNYTTFSHQAYFLDYPSNSPVPSADSHPVGGIVYGEDTTRKCRFVRSSVVDINDKNKLTLYVLCALKRGYKTTITESGAFPLSNMLIYCPIDKYYAPIFIGLGEGVAEQYGYIFGRYKDWTAKWDEYNPSATYPLIYRDMRVKNPTLANRSDEEAIANPVPWTDVWEFVDVPMKYNVVQPSYVKGILENPTFDYKEGKVNQGNTTTGYGGESFTGVIKLGTVVGNDDMFMACVDASREVMNSGNIAIGVTPASSVSMADIGNIPIVYTARFSPRYYYFYSYPSPLFGEKHESGYDVTQYTGPGESNVCDDTWIGIVSSSQGYNDIFRQWWKTTVPSKMYECKSMMPLRKGVTYNVFAFFSEAWLWDNKANAENTDNTPITSTSTWDGFVEYQRIQVKTTGIRFRNRPVFSKYRNAREW